MGITVNINGTLKKLLRIYGSDGGVIRLLQSVSANVGGTIKVIYKAN